MLSLLACLGCLTTSHSLLLWLSFSYCIHVCFFILHTALPGPLFFNSRQFFILVLHLFCVSSTFKSLTFSGYPFTVACYTGFILFISEISQVDYLWHSKSYNFQPEFFSFPKTLSYWEPERSKVSWVNIQYAPCKDDKFVDP